MVGKQELLKQLWAGTYVTKAVLKVAVRAIREALEDDAAAPQYIETVGREGYRFIQPIPATPPPVASSRFQVSSSQLHPTPSPQPLALTIVGRDAELEQLRKWFRHALGGKRQVIFVTGEPGIGKTTVVDLFQEQLRMNEQGVRIGRGQCVEQYGQGEAFLPVLEALSRLGREPGGKQLVEVLRRYAPTWLVQLPALLDEAEVQTLRLQVAGMTRERMLRELAEALEVLTTERPLVLTFEDLHWSDASTLELLAYLAQRRDRARLLLIGTYPRGVLPLHGGPGAVAAGLSGPGPGEDPRGAELSPGGSSSL